MKKLIGLLIAFILLFGVIVYKIQEQVYLKGFDKGEEVMFKAITDTIIVICNRQMKSDTSVTKLIIVNPDTNVFILSQKSINLLK